MKALKKQGVIKLRPFLTKQKPETRTPPMSVYSWPQINPPGKYNPPLCHLSLLVPAHEHTGMPRSGDTRQPMKDTCECCVFFFPVLHGNGRQENRPSMQAAISASPGPPSLFLSHTLWLAEAREVWHLKIQEDQSGLCLALSLSFCLSVFLFPRYKSTTTHAKKWSGSVPVHFLDKCEQNVNGFQSTHIQTPSPEQARGQKVDGWQQATWCNRSSYWRESEGVRPSAQVKTTHTHTEALTWWTAPLMCFFFYYYY